ncbi:DNA phosphorothioation-associated putative methyltransferase [Planktothrix mougeotii]|uniref:DNA phosphorothioation-associated putative methyltransferase n=1 Tax=Planktothrix mougeotii LEGE 06226 TaxID=1828728 RepID=A0ABR9UFZ3_9CYAN|nr:DNA phosphorothioation-associated putative methyltransferase [Planktothrix mougeotii]MBE9145390.1 DNA phosphorothioation-associated putative methyltransferase [Planktothrix mougeotii LEGE 06226]
MSSSHHLVFPPQSYSWECLTASEVLTQQNSPNGDVRVGNNLLMFLALQALQRQVPPRLNCFKTFSPEIQQEIYNYFGSYQQTCLIIDQLLLNLQNPTFINQSCQQSSLGKKLPNALYIHRSALGELNILLRIYEQLSRFYLPLLKPFTLIKFHTNQPVISYLFYPDFDQDPHPALTASFQVNVKTGQVNLMDYSNSDNPPILHRKETFVSSDYPHYEKFTQLTQTEEKLGLLEPRRVSVSALDAELIQSETRLYRTIGTRKGWQQHLNKHGVEIQDHQVIKIGDHLESLIPINPDDPLAFLPKIERHRAALPRKTLSRPVRLALEAELFQKETTFFDYGCGYGGDIQRLAEQGYISTGWDPYYSPQTPRVESDIVNLGYVINVIECQTERREALIQAWNLTQKVLIIAAQVLVDTQEKGIMVYGDGVITSRNTFQKYYQQEELKVYIDQVLNVDAIPLDLGVYIVFRDETEAEKFRASRFRSRLTSPKVRLNIKRFEDYQDLLQPLIQFVSDRGRLPVETELPEEEPIKQEFGSLKRAFQLILQATNPDEWDIIAHKRRQDLLVYIALSRFGRRPKLFQLSEQMKNDIKGLFGSYKKSCNLADLMLYTLGDPKIIANHCQNSAVGQKRANSLWIHISALEKLDPLLRLYEGCASQTLGRPEGANLIKFHIKTPKISYLFSPDFDLEPHPTLSTCMQIDLRDLQVSYQAYDGPNPPILHRKETLVTPEYPHYQQLVRLSDQEEKWGLLDNFRLIRTRLGWLKCLEDHCAEIRGYRVYWRTDADPYRVKLLRSARRARKKLQSCDP